MLKWLVFSIVILLSGCQSTEQYGLWQVSNRPLGQEVRRPFNDMAAAAWRGEQQVGEVYFDFDDHALSNEAKQRLSEMARALNQHHGQVIVAGHADHHNTNAYNKRLGYQRAIQVADYLKSAGVWEERLVIRSLGETRPAASHWTNAGSARNRRVAVSIFDQGRGISGREAQRIFDEFHKKEQAPPPPMKLGNLLSQEVNMGSSSEGGNGGRQ